MSVYDEIAAERSRQDAKWGVQCHPDVPSPFGGFGGSAAQQVALLLQIPSEVQAKRICGCMVDAGRITWAHILVEELAEAVGAGAEGDTANLRAELIQVAAVATAWVQAIDRRQS